MTDQPYLFLDFDGVICDSLNECILSSLYAYFRLYMEKESDPITLPVDYKKRFNTLRPFVRDGEDYLVIHQILEQGREVADQNGFDQILEQHRQKMGLYKELFYKARNIFLETDKEFWLHLNLIYPHMTEHLGTACASPFVYILSTKRADFIKAILENNNIHIPDQRILVAWGVKKLDLISSLLDKTGASMGIFVDDQVHHLLNNKDQRIMPYLAPWGYIQEEWRSLGVKVMECHEMSEVLQGYG